MSTDHEIWLSRYLDGELNDEEQKQALHIIADDPELRSMLKFDLQLRQKLSGYDKPAVTQAMSDADAPSTPEVPEQFFDDVMESIAASGTSSSQKHHKAGKMEPSGKESPDGFLKRLRQPRVVVIRPGWAAAAAVTLLVVAMSLPILMTPGSVPGPTTENGYIAEPGPASTRIPAQQVVEESADRVMMRFVYIDDDAESIEVAGDFSDWDPIALSPQTINGDTAWTGIIPLPRGEHRYMFIRNGEQWETDPLAHRQVDDGFGNRNAIIQL